MDSSSLWQRRKRKRILRPSSYLFSAGVRSLIWYFCPICLLYFLIHRIPLNSLAFRPVLVVSRLSLSSFSYSENDSVVGNLLWKMRIEDLVLFPDHVLLLVKGGKKRVMEKGIGNVVCVYASSLLNEQINATSGEDGGLIKRNALSFDEYEASRFIVRCPIPPLNFSATQLGLQLKLRRGVIDLVEANVLGDSNRTFNSWDNVVYAATLDGDTAVVFAKGLNLRPDRESDPGQFTCHFGLGNWEKDGNFQLTTKAVTAAQEVVRCLLPQSMRGSPEKGEGIRVTIGMTPHVHARTREPVVLPSVAKISKLGYEERTNKGKYELCACTMVWNQASALSEWIMYHTWLGIGRWFIYDNNSDDRIEEVIEELDLNGYNVTRHVWPWIKTQEAGFSHCALRAKDECKWVSFMDVDEFFYFPYSISRHQRFYAGQNALQELVVNFTSVLPQIAEIRTSCHSFGPSGLKSPPSQGVTVGYTCRLKSPERHKSIIRPDALDPTLLNVVHHFHLKKGHRYLNMPQGTAVLNHYKYQVWEVFRAKFFRRVATYVADWQDNQNEGSRDRAPGLGTEAIEPPNWLLQFCEVWDTGLRDFVLSNIADVSTGLLPWERFSSL